MSLTTDFKGDDPNLSILSVEQEARQVLLEDAYVTLIDIIESVGWRTNCDVHTIAPMIELRNRLQKVVRPLSVPALTVLAEARQRAYEYLDALPKPGPLEP